MPLQLDHATEDAQTRKHFYKSFQRTIEDHSIIDLLVRAIEFVYFVIFR